MTSAEEASLESRRLHDEAENAAHVPGPAIPSVVATDLQEPTSVAIMRYTPVMTIDTTTLLEQALSLPEHERAKIAARLLESLDDDLQSDVDAAWAAEIERRCAAVDAGTLSTSDWKDVRARIEREIFGR